MLGSLLHRQITRILLLVLLGSLAACSGVENLNTDSEVQQQAVPTSTPIPTAPAVARPTYLVQRGTVQEVLDFTGRWQPRDQLALSFEIAGTIRRVNVQRGDTVNAGDLLADYEITNLENQLASAQLQLETAQQSVESGTAGNVQSITNAEISLANARIQLENTRASSPWTSLESARLSLESAKQSLENAQRSYNDAISRPDNPASVVDSAYQQLQNAENSVKNAQNQYYSAAQSFNNHQFSVQQAENSVIQAEINLEQARLSASPDEQSVRSAQLNIDQINADIARSSLYAPIAGEVLEVTIRPGDAVQAFTTVITIGLPEPKEVVASLAIGDAQRLSVGLVGVCNVINDPDSAVQCVVRQIPLSSRDADQTTRVAASLENVATNQLVEVEMPLQVRENVLWLPPAAIRTFQNRTFVVLDTPDGPRSVDVELGLQTDERDEIISGVNEGDVVQGP
ncbi:MAG: biotin/lipoyl-binding protein [Anaerolineaceae bacterium]|nr:biotin/lipoyl-binding protein [Anaerolineaceae bacterium]